MNKKEDYGRDDRPFSMVYGNRGISLRENLIGLREQGHKPTGEPYRTTGTGYKPTGELYRATGMVISLRGKVFP